MAKVEANIDGLERLSKMLKESYTVKVGIIGSKAITQHEGNITNAELGAFHEFGTSRMPQRSFLMMPLTEKLSEEIPKMKKIIWKQFFVKNSVRQFYQDLGVKAIKIIEDAFNTNGFGQWKPLTASTIGAFEKSKGIKGWQTGTVAQFRKGLRIAGGRQILTDSGKLRRSISFKVIKGR